MLNKMPKRITVTLSNPIYALLVQLSEVKDKAPASLAAEAVETRIETEIAAGVISEGTSETVDADKNQGFELLDSFLTKLSKGRQPDQEELAKIAQHTSVSAATLSRMCSILTDPSAEGE